MLSLFCRWRLESPLVVTRSQVAKATWSREEIQTEGSRPRCPLNPPRLADLRQWPQYCRRCFLAYRMTPQALNCSWVTELWKGNGRGIVPQLKPTQLPPSPSRRLICGQAAAVMAQPAIRVTTNRGSFLAASSLAGVSPATVWPPAPVGRTSPSPSAATMRPHL